MAQKTALSLREGDSDLTHYLNEVRRFPMLEPQEEYMLAKRWQEHGDRDAANRLVTSHLRLVAKIAMGYRGYGLPISEIISEGNIGLMQGVKRFDPDKGFRLATYAMWWIKASIQEYVIRSWSLVKMSQAFLNVLALSGRKSRPLKDLPVMRDDLVMGSDEIIPNASVHRSSPSVLRRRDI